MKVEWKCSVSSEVDIEFKRMTDYPYPDITCEVVERKTYKGICEVETYMINGIPLLKSNPKQMIESIYKIQQEILNLLILEPRDYEPDVPRVYGTRSVDRQKAEQGGIE